MPVKAQRIRDARVLHRDTLEQLADKLQVTKQAISKYENGKMIPVLEVLNCLMRLYGITPEFLQKEDRCHRDCSPLFFRKSGRVSKKEIEFRETLTRYAFEILEVCSRFGEINRLKLPSFDGIGRIEDKAHCLREFWKMGMGPITNLEYVLSRYGIYTFVYDFEDEKLDGCARRIGPNGIIIINKTHGTSARQQFDLAHELGHIVLDTENEVDANAFAGAFLLPKFQMERSALRTDIDYLLKIKTNWGVSISCMIERYYNLGLLGDGEELNRARYENLRRQIRSRGWRTCEPGDTAGAIENSLQISKVIAEIWADLGQRESFLTEMYIPIDLVKAICALPPGIFDHYVKRLEESEIEGAQLSFTFV